MSNFELGSGTASGAASGAQAGSAFGPWGTAIGAVGGGLLGSLTSSSEDPTWTRRKQIQDDYAHRFQTAQQIADISARLKMSPGAYLHGGGTGSATSPIMAGQTNYGSKGKDIAYGLSQAANIKESQARTDLLKAQAKAIRNPVGQGEDDAATTSQSPQAEQGVAKNVSPAPQSEIIMSPNGKWMFTGKGADAEHFEQRFWEVGGAFAALSNIIHSHKMKMRYMRFYTGKGVVVSDGVMYGIKNNGQLEELAVVGKVFKQGVYGTGKK